jgi:signal transduction histidine kinase
VGNGSIIFEVEDNGFGIPPAELETIFGKFKQLTNGTKLSRGFGLGLMIAHEIVEAHGGTIKAESGGSIAKGSRFTVQLPAV